MILLFRLYEVQRWERDQNEEPTGEILTSQEPMLIGSFPDMDTVKRRIKAEGEAKVEEQAPPATYPLERFAVYEATKDADSDGFPDAFTFADVYTASVPEPVAPVVRKTKRA